MNQVTESSPPAVAVLCEDAHDYRAHLAELAQEGVPLEFHDAVDSIHAASSRPEVLLAQPDMAAAALEFIGTVQWVQSTWAGITPLLKPSLPAFTLTGVKDVFGSQMAEYVMGHLLGRTQKLNDRRRHQQARVWASGLSSEALTGQCMGIMGTGSIGSHIAAVATAFGMRVIGYSASGSAVDGFSEVYSADDLEGFLCKVDVLVAVLPDTPQTTHLLNAKTFACLKPDCVLINVGRGNLVDEDALVEALAQNQLAHAVLDVFESEPLPLNSPLWTSPCVTVTPHIAARSWPQDIASIFLQNFRRYRDGQTLMYQVDRRRGY